MYSVVYQSNIVTWLNDHLEDYNLRSFHSAVSAGEPLNREVIDQFKKYFDITVREGYGQTKN